MPSRNYLVCVLDEKLDENEMEYSQVVDWCHNNLGHPNVLVLDFKDLKVLQEGESLDIINKNNNSMIEEGEDDWIIHKEIKERIQIGLKIYIQGLPSSREYDILNEILRLLEVSINLEKNLYFLF